MIRRRFLVSLKWGCALGLSFRHVSLQRGYGRCFAILQLSLEYFQPYSRVIPPSRRGLQEGSPATSDVGLPVDEMDDSIAQVLNHVCYGSQRSEGYKLVGGLGDCVHGRGDESRYGVDAVVYVGSDVLTNLVHKFHHKKL